MTIKVTYNVTDVYVTQDVSPVYINVSYSSGGGSGAAVWGGITGTLSNQTDLQTALDLKVPYTGATTNVNLGEYEIKAGQVTLDTSPTGTAAVGTTRWNDTTGLSETTLKGGTVVLKNGVDLVARVVNKVSPNTTLTKAAYQAVRVSGAQGQRLAVAFAQANNDNNSADTIGLVTETIATNQEGFIITVGQLENINTTGSLQGETWADGDVLYLSPTTAGALTNVKPNATIGHIVVIGYVEYAHAVNGKIYVKVMNGWELGELHDVYVPTPSNNDVLTYETSSGLWKNKSIVTALGYTPANAATTLTINGVSYDLSANRTWSVGTITGSGASGQVAYWTGASAQSGDNNLFWNSASIRLGIGRTPSARRLEIQVGNGGIASALGIYDGGGTLNTIFGIETASTTDFQIASVQSIRFYSGSTLGNVVTMPTNERMRLYSTGNLLLQSGGTFTDSGQRLQVIGDTLLKGSANTSGSTALLVENSDASDLFTVLNNGYTRYGNGGVNAPRIFSTSVGSGGDVDLAGQFLAINLRSTTTETSTFGLLTINGLTGTATTGTQTVVAINKGFAPTSGTATYTALLYNSTINQTGGANGITRGLHINPTLTAAADWRSIEWSNNSGWGLYGAGTANNYLGGNLLLGSTTSSGERLQVTGTMKVTGATNLSSSLTVGTSITANFTDGFALNFGVFNLRASGSRIQYETTYQSGHYYVNNGASATSGSGAGVYLGYSFAPTSGTATHNYIQIVSQINQTNGANGISRGIYINPVLTSAADFRAIETTNGKVIFGNLPTSSAGLPTGAIWNNGGVINIV